VTSSPEQPAIDNEADSYGLGYGEVERLRLIEQSAFLRFPLNHCSIQSVFDLDGAPSMWVAVRLASLTCLPNALGSASWWASNATLGTQRRHDAHLTSEASVQLTSCRPRPRAAACPPNHLA
jgi:hypothetical protein